MAKELKVIDIRDSEGKNQGTIEVDVSSLESEKSKKVVSDVLLMYLSNQKKRTASTKSRLSLAVTPTVSFRPGNSPSIRLHWSSLKA